MIAINPFAGNDPEGAIWEEGFLAGFQQPDVNNQPPLHPNLLDVYQQGNQAGQEFKSNPPEDGKTWGEINEVVSDLIRDKIIEWTIEKVLEPVAGTFASLLAILPGVIAIQGDTPLSPLPENFNRILGNNDSLDDPRYIALCMRNDHDSVSVGVTNQGLWTGQVHTEFGDALAEMQAHNHAEAFIIRCSLTTGSCGIVWVTKTV